VVANLHTPLFVEPRHSRSAALDQGGPTPPRTEGELAGSLQRELRRVGCYLGEVDGIWGTGSRRAMAAFNERVNAVLPVEQPDTILLRLVSAHVGTACGSACPRGQAFAPDGRCMPNAILARASRPAGSFGPGPRIETAAGPIAARAVPTARLTAAQGPAYEPTSSTMRPAPFAQPQPGFEGRMAVGGPHVGLPARPGPESAEEQRAREARAPRRPSRSHRVTASRFPSASRSTRWTATFFGNP
jgi:peptidoglycan hydrolase-like protein with peptidoglycan-binding domain